jgi:hypothetical protein
MITSFIIYQIRAKRQATGKPVNGLSQTELAAAGGPDW